uniref:Putative secreted protein n=1 Tax=Ixodes ricinus TaxID=34613 RepID=A0A6B0UTP8_IXORI
MALKRVPLGRAAMAAATLLARVGAGDPTPRGEGAGPPGAPPPCSWHNPSLRSPWKVHRWWAPKLWRNCWVRDLSSRAGIPSWVRDSRHSSRRTLSAGYCLWMHSSIKLVPSLTSRPSRRLCSVLSCPSKLVWELLMASHEPM